jgi:hypothetical protein
MDPVTRVREYLLDNVGHLTYPGRASFDPGTQRWFVPSYYRADRGSVVVGDVELDCHGHILFAPSREERLTRLSAPATAAPQSGSQGPSVGKLSAGAVPCGSVRILAPRRKRTPIRPFKRPRP